MNGASSVSGAGLDVRSILDRLVSSIALLALAGVAALTFLLALGVLSPAQLGGGWEPATRLFAAPSSLAGWPRLAVLGGSLVVGLGALALMVGRPGGSGSSSFGGLPRAGHHVVTSDDLGFVVVDTEGVRAIVERAVLGSRGVVECIADVRGTGSSPVRVILKVGVRPGTSVQDAADLAREAARDAVERLLGLEIRDVSARVSVLDADELGRWVA
ncbi:MAG TPA: hypothetical protein RMH99_20165 [Sandaracinaceae bacterium LLY-WYZ-13_1]|nr:hypothetical protein [Sandaracinaceae bacterium LLY-WYZ-13_1]